MDTKLMTNRADIQAHTENKFPAGEKKNKKENKFNINILYITVQEVLI